MDRSTLNDQQRAAALHGPGPACVIAGAGSGKTRVLTYRIARLVEDGVDPERILAVTFTRKAAGEMLDRLGGLVGSSVEALTVGTFHSVCYRVIREEYRYLGREIPSPAEEYWQKRTIRDILSPDCMNWHLDLAFAMGFISAQKNNLLGPRDKLLMPEGREFEEQRFRDLYLEYESRKAEENRLDFDDMLLWCHRLLAENPDIRAKYRRRWQWLLVDEFQDTNLAQYAILRQVAPPENNLFVVGDDYQAIYGWRNAVIDFILNFEKEWPGARVYRLETNYRSTENIVESSNTLIRFNARQARKVCKAIRPPARDPVLLSSSSEDDEGRQVAERVVSLALQGHKYGDMAVLYRTNAQSRALEEALVQRNVPYVVFGGTGFYERKEVKDVIAYVRAALRKDDDAFRRIVNVPSRYLGKAFLAGLFSWASARAESLVHALCSGQCAVTRQRKWEMGAFQLASVLTEVEAHRDDPPAALVRRVRDLTKYDRYLIEEEGGEEGPDNEKVENLNMLEQAASRFESAEAFLEYASSMSGRDQENGPDRVQLMTLHKAKGLEFPVVFLAGVSEGLLPHRRSVVYGPDGSVIPESVEEERRLMYVGMTRAMDLLHVSSPETYMGKPTAPSMFLSEIAEVTQSADSQAVD